MNRAMMKSPAERQPARTATPAPAIVAEADEPESRHRLPACWQTDAGHCLDLGIDQTTGSADVTGASSVSVAASAASADAAEGEDLAANWSRVLHDECRQTACQLVDAALDALVIPAPAGRIELAILLGDDAGIAKLNQQFRQRHGATNVLSFPAAESMADSDDDSIFLGDIALALETLEREAAERGIAATDHFLHLLLHGLLHCLGLDHETDAEAVIMEDWETRLLGLVGIADPHQPVVGTG